MSWFWERFGNKMWRGTVFFQGYKNWMMIGRDFVIVDYITKSDFIFEVISDKNQIDSCH